MKVHLQKSQFNESAFKITPKKPQFPSQCIVCGKDLQAEAERTCDIFYHPKQKSGNPWDKLILQAPLCEEHFHLYQKGQKMARRAMYLLFSGIIPMIIGLILQTLDVSKAAITAVFIVALVIVGIGYALLNPSNKLLKENGRGMIEIGFVTGSEIILEVKNEELARKIIEFHEKK